MKNRHYAVPLSLLASLVVATAFGCGGKKEGAAGSSGGLLMSLPKDTQIVVGISPKAISETALYKQYGALLAAGPMQEMKSKCAIDPLADFSLVVIGVPAEPDPETIVYGSSGNFDEAKLGKCFKELGGGSDPVKEGALVKYEAQGAVTYAYWISGNSVLFSRSSARLQSVVDGATLAGNDAMKTLIGKLNHGATLFGGGLIPDQAKGAMAMLGGQTPQSFYGSVDYKDDLKAKVSMVYPDGGTATAQAEKLSGALALWKDNPMVAQFKDILGNLSFKASGSEVVADLALTAAQIQQLSATVPMMMGGM